MLSQLRDALAAVTGPLTEFTSRVTPAVTAISDLIGSVRIVVDAFDLAPPTAAVLEVLHRTRDTVAAIDVSLLPAAAVQLVGEAADALANIDIAGAVSGPLVEVLDAIDPGPILDTAVDALAEVSTQLAVIDPSQLIATLEEPVSVVLDGLASLDPTQLRTMIDDALAPVRDAIDALDAATVLAPAVQAYADVTVKLDTLLDPAPIFEPLQSGYQPILDLVAALDPTKLLDLVTPHIAGATESFGGAAGSAISPDAVTGGTAGGSVGFTALPSTVDASDDLFGFRPGDLLVPLIDLHARLMAALGGLGDELVDQSAAALHAAFGGRLASLRPDSVLARIDATLASVESELGIVATTTAVSGAALAYQRLAAHIAIVAPNAAGDDAPVAVRVNASLPTLDPLRLVADSAQATALAAGAALATSRVDLASLRSSYAVSVGRLERLLPEFLGDGLDGSGLLGALRALDPAPIRDEVNQLFDEAGRFLAGLGESIAAAMEEVATAAADLLQVISPTSLLDLVSRIHAGVEAQVEALAPATLAEHVRLIFGAVRRQLRALDPAQLAAQVDAVRESLLTALDELLDGLLPDPAPLRLLQQQLDQLRPSRLLAPVTAAFAPISELAGRLDADGLVQPLVEGIDRIKEQVPDVIAQLEAAFDEVLRAFPQGGVTGVSGSASANVSVG